MFQVFREIKTDAFKQRSFAKFTEKEIFRTSHHKGQTRDSNPIPAFARRSAINPGNHLLISWISANTIELNLRERKIITLAGLAPDLDGVGLLIDPVAEQFGTHTYYWDFFHHQLHNIGFCILLTAMAFVMAKAKKLVVSATVFVVFHLHLFCDLIGSRGPDGYQWPIPYFLPFTDRVQLTWQHQWELNAWPNILIVGISIGIVIIIARLKKRSPFEIISKKMDLAFTGRIRPNHKTRT